MSQESHTSKGETALAAFTILMPASAGISWIGLLEEKASILCIAAAVVGALGLAASLAHLARPLRAPFSIIHWRQSWLSREIMAACGYWFLVLAWCLAEFVAQPGIARILAICAVVAGLGMLFVIAQSYRLHTRPAWNGSENVAELFGVMLGMGTAIGMLLANPVVTPILSWGSALWIGLGAGLEWWAFKHRYGRLLQMPQQSHIAATSANYQRLATTVQISLGLNILALILSIAAGMVPPWGVILWSIILCAELISHVLARIVFYSLPVQTRFVPRLREPWSRAGQADG